MVGMTKKTKNPGLELVQNLVAHGDAREGKRRGNWRMEWVASTLTPPPNVVYPALLRLMRTPRLPAVDWTDAPTDLNGLVRLGERRNLVSARVITLRTGYTAGQATDDHKIRRMRIACWVTRATDIQYAILSALPLQQWLHERALLLRYTCIAWLVYTVRATVTTVGELKANMCYSADKSLARPASRCILFDGENISFDASLVLYIYK